MSEAVIVLSSGGIVLHPTDTVFGLAVDATNPNAIQKLIDLKGRGADKHISIVVTDVAMLEQYAVVTPLAKRLITQFLPGKLTLVLEARGLPKELSQDGTIGVRIPNNEEILALVRELGRPITSTSANRSGMPAGTTVADILDQLESQEIMIYHNPSWPKKLPVSLPSTVVDARGEKPILIRAGAVEFEKLTDFLARV